MASLDVRVVHVASAYRKPPPLGAAGAAAHAPAAASTAASAAASAAASSASSSKTTSSFSAHKKGNKAAQKKVRKGSSSSSASSSSSFSSSFTSSASSSSLSSSSFAPSSSSFSSSSPSSFSSSVSSVSSSVSSVSSVSSSVSSSSSPATSYWAQHRRVLQDIGRTNAPAPYSRTVHNTFFSLFHESSALVSNHDIGQTPALDEFRVQRLRAQFRQISGKALVVITHIASASNFFTKPSLVLVEKQSAEAATASPTKSSECAAAGAGTSFDMAKHIGTTPRTLSQLISRQVWLTGEERDGMGTLFALLRPRASAKDAAPSLQQGGGGQATTRTALASTTSAQSQSQQQNAIAAKPPPPTPPTTIAPPILIDTGALLRTMGQFAQALQRILLYCSHEPRDNELFATHQKVSIIIQRWIKDYTIGKENELYTESVALSTFKEEERDFKAHMSRLKHRWRTQQQRLLLACFEADHLFCLLVTLDRRFLMQHAVSEDERRLFVTTTGKLSKLQQHHNEHVAVELPRWRTIVNEGVVFKEGSLLHTSSVSMERALQRRVAAEICNMSFIVLSATYAIVIGGHLNRSIVGFGPVYTPSWWPSIWFGHSILVLLAFATIAWNWFSLDTIVGGSRYGEGGAGGAGVGSGAGEVGVGVVGVGGGTASAYSAAGQHALHDAKNQPLVLQYYYWCLTSIGTSRGTALLLLIVGLLSLVTMVLTVCILRGIGIVIFYGYY